MASFPRQRDPRPAALAHVAGGRADRLLCPGRRAGYGPGAPSVWSGYLRFMLSWPDHISPAHSCWLRPPGSSPSLRSSAWPASPSDAGKQPPIRLSGQVSAILRRTDMRVMDVVNETKAAMRASEVFGTPYEKNGVTIIPAARIAGGAGGGGDQQGPHAGGVGFGASSRPGRAFVSKGGAGTCAPSPVLEPGVTMGQGGAPLAPLST